MPPGDVADLLGVGRCRHCLANFFCLVRLLAELDPLALLPLQDFAEQLFRRDNAERYAPRAVSLRPGEAIVGGLGRERKKRAGRKLFWRDLKRLLERQLGWQRRRLWRRLVGRIK